MKSCSYSIHAILLIVFCLSGNIFAQGESLPMRISLFGGMVFPQGDFGTNSMDKGGYAKTDFGGMIEMSKRLKGKARWVTSISLDANKLDVSAMESQSGNIHITGGSYTTIWAMTGIGLETSSSSNIKVYIIVQGGMLISSVPDISYYAENVPIKQTTALGNAFAFGFGGGVIINKINFGLRCYTGEPEYEQTVTYGRYSHTANDEMRTTVLQLMIGINFL